MQCRLVEVEDPLCIHPTGQVGIWDRTFPGRCLTPLGNPSNVQPVCEGGSSWSVATIPDNKDFDVACVKITRETPLPECDVVGELNEETGMCEVRAGRNNNNNSA